MTADGVLVRPVQPPQFHSLPHPTKTCQAAVAVACGSATVFNVSLCDPQLVQDSAAVASGRRASGRQGPNAVPGLALARCLSRMGWPRPSTSHVKAAGRSVRWRAIGVSGLGGADTDLVAGSGGGRLGMQPCLLQGVLQRLTRGLG